VFLYEVLDAREPGFGIFFAAREALQDVLGRALPAGAQVYTAAQYFIKAKKMTSTDAQKLASTIVGLSAYTSELTAMGGWTPQKAVQMANQREKILAGLTADNAQKDPSEQLSNEDIKAEAARQYMRIFSVEMDPGRALINYSIDSLNSKLGNYLIGPENPFLRGTEYAFTGVNRFFDAPGDGDSTGEKTKAAKIWMAAGLDLLALVRAPADGDKANLLFKRKIGLPIYSGPTSRLNGSPAVYVNSLVGYGDEGEAVAVKYEDGHWGVDISRLGLSEQYSKELGLESSKVKAGDISFFNESIAKEEQTSGKVTLVLSGGKKTEAEIIAGGVLGAMLALLLWWL